MPRLDDTHVLIKDCFIVWDAITSPDPVPNDPTAKSYAVKIVVAATSPDIAELDGLAKAALAAHPVFKGVLPSGGRYAIDRVDPNEYEGLFPNHVVINCKSRRAPDIRDENGRQLDPMQYGPMIYAGQCIDVVVHAYAYNTASKGVCAGLDGFVIRTSANAPRRSFGGGGYNMSSLQYSGGAPAQQPPAYGAPAQQPPAYGAPAQQPPAYGAPAQQPPAYGAPAQQAPAYGAPAQQPPAYGAPAQQAPAYGAPAQQAPAYGAPAQQAPAPNYTYGVPQ